MSHYVIGDVQGCYDELINLCSKIKFNPKKDTLIFAGDLVNRGNKKILGIKYTPDFIGLTDEFIIECKGRANDTFPMRWKLFKKFVKDNIPSVTLYKPQNQKECDKVIELITKKNKR